MGSKVLSRVATAPLSPEMFGRYEAGDTIFRFTSEQNMKEGIGLSMKGVIKFTCGNKFYYGKPKIVFYGDEKYFEVICVRRISLFY